ncbi:MAG: energy transducer TonB [Arcobacter sp.]|uniref:energy transducer TonB n=1 Tax=Arcobacter sp. TaxID=1872629 RepID=UPI003D0694A4
MILNEPKIVQKISLNHIELEKKPVVNQIKEENIIQKEKKEQIKEEIKPEPIEKVVKKEEKKKVPKKPKEKKIEKEKAVKKEEVKEQKNPTKEENVKENIVDNNIQKETKELFALKPVIDEKKEYLEKHLALIRDLINQNIKYPLKAKKLSIQGVVTVKFKLNEDGVIENITIIDGHKFLQNATIEAIEEASKKFPKTNKSIEIQIPIEYKLI